MDISLCFIVERWAAFTGIAARLWTGGIQRTWTNADADKAPGARKREKRLCPLINRRSVCTGGGHTPMYNSCWESDRGIRGSKQKFMTLLNKASIKATNLPRENRAIRIFLARLQTSLATIYVPLRSNHPQKDTWTFLVHIELQESGAERSPRASSTGFLKSEKSPRKTETKIMLLLAGLIKRSQL